MAILTTTVSTSSVSKIFRDLDSDNTVETNLNSGACTIQQIYIDNSANASTDFYLHMWNQTSAPTFGATVPSAVLFAPAGTSKTYIFPDGFAFGTGLCIGGSTNFAAVTFTEANPSASVPVTIYVAA